MGLYDRDYYRESPNRYSRTRRRGPLAGKSIVFILIAINAALFLANGLFCPQSNALTNLLMMHGVTMYHPLYWFQLLTYGFVQSPNDLMHILCNMLVLFFFGPPIERRYGSGEFLAFYLLAVLCGGLVWGFAHLGDQRAGMLGASGAVSAVVILFSINYPNVTVLLFGVIPMPAWICGIGYVVYDALGTMNGNGPIAHEVHLAGAFFALAYYFLNRRLTTIFSSVFSLPRQKNRKSKLRVVDYRFDNGTDRNEQQSNDRLGAEVDRILKKISLSGEASLSDTERATLRRASQEYQKRNREK